MSDWKSRAEAASDSHWMSRATPAEETLGSQAKYGFLEGLSNSAHALSDAGGVENFQWRDGGPEYVDKPAQDEHPEPQTGGQRFVRRASQTVGGTLPFVPLGLAAGVPATAEAVGTGLSAIGSGTVSALYPGHPGLEALAEVAAPFAPHVTMTGQLVRNAPKIWRAGKDKYKDFFDEDTNMRAAEETVSGALGQKFGPPEQAAADRAQELSATIPGFKPSLGEALHETTSGKDLLTTQRNIEKEGMTPEERSAASQRYQDNLSAIHEHAETHAPGDPVEPQEVVDSISGKVTDLRRPLQAQIADVDQAQKTLGAALPTDNKLQTGQQLRGQMEGMRSAETQRMSQLADNLGLNNPQGGIPFKGFKDNITKKYGLQRGEDPQNQPYALNLLENDDTPNISFDSLMKYRTTMASALRKAVFDKNDLMARKLSGMIYDTDAYILTGAAKSSDPNFSAAYDTFKSQYKNDVVDRFKQGVAYKVRQKNGENFYQTQDENVAKAFWGTPSGARQFNTTFRGDPDATAALKNSVLDDLRQSAYREGKISQPLFDMWYRRNEQSLNQLPEIKDTVTNIRTATQNLAERQADLAARSAEINNQTLVKRLDSIGAGKLKPEAIATQALGSPTFMRQVLNTVGADQGTRQAWTRLLWDRAVNSSPEEMEGMLANPSVKMAMGDQHINHLRDIFDALKMAKSAGKMEGKDITPDLYGPIKGITGQAIESIASKFWAVETGRTSGKFAAINIGSSTIRKQRINAIMRVLKRALYQPQVAKAMSESLHDSSPIAASRMKMRGYLFNAGLDMLGNDDGDDSKRPPAAPDVPDSEDNVYARR